MQDSACYLWQPPGHPTRVLLDLAVLDKLNALIRQTTVLVESETTKRPLETGAILLGRRLSCGAIAIDSFEEIDSEHRRGASFALSASDSARLGRRVARLSQHGRTVVGYFRIHTRSGLYLDQDDENTIRQFFAQPWQVVLLAKPMGDAPPQAGFFFWDQGEMDRRQTVLSFPLSREALRESGFPVVQESTSGPGPGQQATQMPQRRNWIPVAGAVAFFALAAVFIPTGVITAGRSSSTRAHAVASRHIANEQPRPAPTDIARVDSGTSDDQGAWPAPDDVQKVNAASIRHSPVHTRRVPPPRSFVSPVNLESAVGPPPARDEIASLPPPPIDSAPPPAIVLPTPQVKRIATRPDISLEPAHRSALRTTLGHIPLVGKLGHRHSAPFIPARPVRDGAPVVPLELSSELTRDEPVLLRIRIATNGTVSETQLLSRKSDPTLASIATHAASTWDFIPAREGDKAVPSDMLVRFRFHAAP